DLEGRLLSINANGLAQLCVGALGRGTSWLDLWKGEHREAATRAVEAARGGGVGRFVGFCPMQDGTPRWWDVVVSPLRGDGGAVEHLLAVSRDVTEQKRAEEALRFLSAASTTLAASLDYAQTLANVADLIVPALADWCAIDVLEDDGTINLVAVVHADPARVELAHALRKRYPTDPRTVRWTQQSEPELIPEVTDEMLVAGTL